MSKQNMPCPVCGILNERDTETMWGIGTVEDSYYCQKCSYFFIMAYSPYYEGIGVNFPKEYENRVKELGLNVVPEEEIP